MSMSMSKNKHVESLSPGVKALGAFGQGLKAGKQWSGNLDQTASAGRLRQLAKASGVQASQLPNILTKAKEAVVDLNSRLVTYDSREAIQSLQTAQDAQECLALRQAHRIAKMAEEVATALIASIEVGRVAA